MDQPNYYYIMAFDTTTSAIAAEKLAKDRIHAALMPVPREISASCGLALRFIDADWDAVREFCNNSPDLHGHLYKMNTERVDGLHPVHLIETYNC